MIMIKKFAKIPFNLIRNQLCSFSSSMDSEITVKNISYIGQEEAQKFDQEMMEEHGHSLPLLMELAGN